MERAAAVIAILKMGLRFLTVPQCLKNVNVTLTELDVSLLCVV